MRVTGLAIAAMLLAAPAAAQTPGASAPELPVRVWSTSDSKHIRFDLPEVVPHRAWIDGDRLTLSFARPVRADLVAVMKGLPDLIGWAEAGADGRSFSFRLNRPAALRQSADGGVLVLHLTPTAAASSSATDAPTDAPTVRVRTGAHRGYTRIVFDWPTLVDYGTVSSDDMLVLNFGAPARLDLSQTGRAASGLRVEPRDDGNAAVALPVPDGGEARHFRLGRRIVVDLYRRAAVARASAAPAPESAAAADGPPPLPTPRPAAPVEMVRGPDSTSKPATASPVVPSAALARNDAPPPAVDVQPTPVQPPAQPPVLPPVTKAAPREQAQTPPAATVPPSAKPTPALPAIQVPPPVDRPAAGPPAQPAQAMPQSPALDAPSGDTPRAPPAAAPVDVPPTPAPAPVRQVAQRPGAANQVLVTRGEARLAITFPGTADARAAVFRRAGHVWVVFDAPGRLELAPLRAAAPDLLPMAEQLSRADAAVYRLQASPGFEPTVGREAAGWVVELRPQSARPERALAVQAEPAAPAGARVVIPVDSPGPVVELVDPDAGDRLLVVPLRVVHLGVAEASNYPEFSLLPTPQGIAVGARTERLRVDARADAVEITTERGLLMRGAAGEAQPSIRRTRVEEGRPALFAFAAWERAQRPFNDVRIELQRALTVAPEAERNAARLELARFFFARGLAAETLGMLDLVAENAPGIADRPQFAAMRGAARLLAGQTGEAAKDLAVPAIDAEPEAALWRGLLAARQHRWRDAAPLLRAGTHLVDGYPAWLQSKFALAGIEAAMETGDGRAADSWVRLLESRPIEEPTLSRLDYLRGRLLIADGSLEAGRRALDKAAAGEDRLARARAGLAKVDLGLADGSLTPKAALDELERLRFAWRGDEFEYEVLTRLGQAYLDAGDYWGGLSVMRDALSIFPEGDHTVALTERMTSAFRTLFAEGEAAELSPLKAMALYEEFRELTPAGSDGDAILRNLAGRLVALDLFEPAAAVLDDLVRNRLTGPARGRAAADLALVHLLDGKPERAVAVLDLVPVGEAGGTMRRRHLRARALAELGRPAEAIRLLSADSSPEAGLLAADLHWRANDWPAAAAMYRKLAARIDPAGPLSPDDARIVLKLAVSQTLAGERAATRDLHTRFGKAMAQTGQAAAFTMVGTATGGDPGLDHIATTLAGVDDFQARLEAYRHAIEKPPSGESVRPGGAS